eukprot:GILI01044528.1.p1 GENE.GILI01044528.1~~GILI01044528.1.p1  ORF type:complete len:220 (-),score=73.77 GILI01044528.1:176-835(-)
MREFRSSLPSFLHAAGMDVVPVTLEVGAYVLSPDICVERKSISDLFQSFSSGHLYNQVEAMSRHYKSPVLLIEFDQAKSFSLQPVSALTGDINPTNIISKLSLLTLHFPQLRLLWSKSQHETVTLFQNLKHNRLEPDPRVAASVGQDPSQSSTDEVNLASLDLLRRLPGVNNYNYRSLMKHLDCLHDLTRVPEADLSAWLGPNNARLLFEVLHKKAAMD